MGGGTRESKEEPMTKGHSTDDNITLKHLIQCNLIPINKIENGKYIKTTNENIIKFRNYLNTNGIVATIRRELGSDIEAACGQLRRKNLKNRGG